MEISTENNHQAEEIILAYQAGEVTQDDAARLLAELYSERIDYVVTKGHESYSRRKSQAS